MRALRAHNNRFEAYTIRTADTWRSNTTFNYGSGSSYALGQVVSQTASTQKNLFAWEHNSTTNSFVWFDGAVQSNISFDSNTSSGSNPIHTTTFNRDSSGDLTSTYINDGRPRTVAFTNGINGQVIERKESSSAATEPREVYYRFGGKEMGRVGNNGDFNMDYAASIADRTTTPVTGASAGAFRNGASSGVVSADFDQNYNAINSYGQGSTSGSYTVRSGDTLAGIAASVYGDSSLWYKIAAANGLQASSNLTEGTTIQLPAGVQNYGDSNRIRINEIT